MSTTEQPLEAHPGAPEESGAPEPQEAPRRLTLRDIADAKDCATREFAVPEWGGTILLQELSLQEIEDVRSRARAGGVNGEADDTQFALHLVAATMADPDLTPEQTGILGQKSNSVLQRVLVEVLEINGLGEELKQIAERFQD